MAMSEQLDADGGRCLLLLHALCRELNAESKKPAGVKCQKTKKEEAAACFSSCGHIFVLACKKKKKSGSSSALRLCVFFFVTLTKVEPNKLHL